MKKVRRSSKSTDFIASGWAALENPVPGDVLSAVRELEIDIIRVVDDEVVGRCPGHFERKGKEDSHPSWSVNLENGIHHCFSCGFRGTFVELTEYVRNTGRDEAVSWIRERGGIERVRKVLAGGSYIDELVAESHGPIDTTQQINEASLALFDDVPPEVAATRDLDPDVCTEFGVLWDPERELWITPVRDPHTGDLLGWQEKNAREFNNRPKGVEKSRTLFGSDVFVPGTPAVIVESPLDPVRIASAGIDGGLGTWGVRVSDEQMKIVIGLTDEVIVALDDDIDGTRESKRLKEQWGRRIRMRFWNYGRSGAKDPGAMSDEYIAWAYDNAISSILVRL